MVKAKDIFFDSSGNKIIVGSVTNNKISCIRIRDITISYPDSRKGPEREEKKESVDFIFSDIGIRIFYNRMDYEDHKKLSIRDARYTNKEEIIKHFDNEYKKIYNTIKKDAPTGPIMDRSLKDKIIQSYYMKKETEVQENNFCDQNQCDYFARIDLDTHFYKKHYERYLNNHYYDRVYISKGVSTDCSDGVHIVDWRAPIATLYYDKEKTSFVRTQYVDVINEIRTSSPFYIYEHQLMLKRNFVSLYPLKYNDLYISGNEFFNEGTADSFLMGVLLKNRENHRISDIIKTIQSNQNKIIRDNHNRNIIVQGCAGSGKTMILLHRLSYLKYHSLLPSLKTVRIITPNKNFSVFINDLAISLELEDIERTTIFNYYYKLALKYQKTFSENIIKNYDNKKINEEEAKINKLALKNFEHDKISNAFELDEKIIDMYYESSFIFEIKDQYDNFNKELLKKMNIPYIVSLCDKMKITLNQKKITSKQFLDEISSVCKNDLFYANAHLKNEIDKLEVVLNSNNSKLMEIQQYSKLLKILYDSVKTKTSSIRKEYMQSIKLFDDIENFYEIYKKLDILNKEYSASKEKSEKDFKVYKNHLDKKELHLNDLNNTSKSLRIYKIGEKIEILKQISYAKAEIKKLKSKNEAQILNYQNHTFMISKESYNCVKSWISHIPENATPQFYIELISEANQQNLETLNNLLDFAPDNTISKSIIINCYINKLHKIYDILGDSYVSNLVGNIKNNLKIFSGDINNHVRIITSKVLYISRDTINTIINCTDIQSAINSFDNLMNSILSLNGLLQDQENIIITEINQLKDELVRKETRLLNDEDISIINNTKSMLINRGQFVIDFYIIIREIYRKKYCINENFFIYGKHELIILLLVYSFHCGKIESSDRMLFIDEGQDYSINEYKLLRLINSDNCILNIFGDTNQCIHPNRGISKWNDLCDYMNGAFYTLNENYRNTVEISNFTNKSLKLDTLAIGIHGPDVAYVNSDEIKSIIESEFSKDDTQRIAYISNGKYPSSLDSRVYFGSVNESKGLEFDIVFVNYNKMANNERYISFTRALEKLYILKEFEPAN